MTSILALPLLGFDMLVGTNEDWLDAWAYLDASGDPISVAGLTLNFEVRSTAAAANVAVVASTAQAVCGVPVNGTVVAGGAGGNVVALQVLMATMSRLAPGTYVHEMQAQGDGVTRIIARGSVTVVQGIVR